MLRCKITVKIFYNEKLVSFSDPAFLDSDFSQHPTDLSHTHNALLREHNAAGMCTLSTFVEPASIAASEGLNPPVLICVCNHLRG